eukprot:CAMPEP_0115092940 /NCGR_PEP_ID=MMETSP0227-20121206/27137_1 /TAXON_ID=89957 /ORGANISM="Polarella glacialis, Strain CCMP 1383" /LENGTH=109 /DNA_ID=CAMNT_0002484999 /DNA_START=144 /DNA_END=474 /DNA_ORIENTATION=-
MKGYRQVARAKTQALNIHEGVQCTSGVIGVAAEPELAQPDNFLALLAHYLLDVSASILKPTQSVSYKMSVVAVRAGDKNYTVVVRLLGDLLRTPPIANTTCESKRVRLF